MYVCKKRNPAFRTCTTCAPPTTTCADVPGWGVIRSALNYAPGKDFHLPVPNHRCKNPKNQSFFFLFSFFKSGGVFLFTTATLPPRTLKLTPRFFRYSPHKHSSGFETDPVALKPPFFQTGTAKFYTLILRSNLQNFHPLNSGYVKVSNKTPSQENGLCSFPYVKAKAKPHNMGKCLASAGLI